MQITARQIRQLDQGARDEGNRRIAAYIGMRFPPAFAGRDEPQQIAIVERMREAAATWGFERDDHIGTYIALHLMYGAGFVSQPWAAPVLRDMRRSPVVKMRTLVRRVRAAGIDL